MFAGYLSSNHTRNYVGVHIKAFLLFLTVQNKCMIRVTTMKEQDEKPVETG